MKYLFIILISTQLLTYTLNASSKTLLNLEKEISKMLILLEEEKYSTFIKAYIKEDEFNKMNPEQFELFVQKWQQSHKAQQLFKSLQLIEKEDYKKLEISPEKNIVEYNFEKNNILEKISFLYKENKWSLTKGIFALSGETNIDLLIQQMGDDNYLLREQASNQLLLIGFSARNALKQASNSKDPEVNARALLLVEKIGTPPKEITLLKNQKFHFTKEGKRVLKFPIVIPKTYSNELEVTIHIHHSYDDSGDKGVTYRLISGKDVVKEGFYSSRNWKSFSFPANPGDKFTFFLEDKDTKLSGKHAGNGGSVKITCKNNQAE